MSDTDKSENSSVIHEELKKLPTEVISKAKKSHLKDCPSVINIGVVIVSTSRYNEIRKGLPSTDRALPVIRKALNEPVVLDVETAYNIVFEKIIPDDAAAIREIIGKYTGGKNALHCLIFSGGTGITKKDITIETVRPYFDKEMPGFGELFRYLSYSEIGNSTILSRATAGVIENTVVFLIPGSPGAVKTAMFKIIAPELPHVISEIYRELNRSAGKHLG